MPNQNEIPNQENRIIAPQKQLSSLKKKIEQIKSSLQENKASLNNNPLASSLSSYCNSQPLEDSLAHLEKGIKEFETYTQMYGSIPEIKDLIDLETKDNSLEMDNFILEIDTSVKKFKKLDQLIKESMQALQVKIDFLTRQVENRENTIKNLHSSSENLKFLIALGDELKEIQTIQATKDPKLEKKLETLNLLINPNRKPNKKEDESVKKYAEKANKDNITHSKLLYGEINEVVDEFRALYKKVSPLFAKKYSQDIKKNLETWKTLMNEVYHIQAANYNDLSQKVKALEKLCDLSVVSTEIKKEDSFLATILTQIKEKSFNSNLAPDSNEINEEAFNFKLDAVSKKIKEQHSAFNLETLVSVIKEQGINFNLETILEIITEQSADFTLETILAIIKENVCQPESIDDSKHELFVERAKYVESPEEWVEITKQSAAQINALSHQKKNIESTQKMLEGLIKVADKKYAEKKEEQLQTIQEAKKEFEECERSISAIEGLTNEFSQLADRPYTYNSKEVQSYLADYKASYQQEPVESNMEFAVPMPTATFDIDFNQLNNVQKLYKIFKDDQYEKEKHINLTTQPLKTLDGIVAIIDETQLSEKKIVLKKEEERLKESLSKLEEEKNDTINKIRPVITQFKTLDDNIRNHINHIKKISDIINPQDLVNSDLDFVDQDALINQLSETQENDQVNNYLRNNKDLNWSEDQIKRFEKLKELKPEKMKNLELTDLFQEVQQNISIEKVAQLNSIFAGQSLKKKRAEKMSYLLSKRENESKSIKQNRVSQLILEDKKKYQRIVNELFDTESMDLETQEDFKKIDTAYESQKDTKLREVARRPNTGKKVVNAMAGGALGALTYSLPSFLNPNPFISRAKSWLLNLNPFFMGPIPTLIQGANTVLSAAYNNTANLPISAPNINSVFSSILAVATYKTLNAMDTGVMALEDGLKFFTEKFQKLELDQQIMGLLYFKEHYKDSSSHPDKNLDKNLELFFQKKLSEIFNNAFNTISNSQENPSFLEKVKKLFIPSSNSKNPEVNVLLHYNFISGTLDYYTFMMKEKGTLAKHPILVAIGGSFIGLLAAQLFFSVLILTLPKAALIAAPLFTAQNFALFSACLGAVLSQIGIRTIDYLKFHRSPKERKSIERRVKEDREKLEQLQKALPLAINSETQNFLKNIDQENILLGSSSKWKEVLRLNVHETKLQKLLDKSFDQTLKIQKNLLSLSTQEKLFNSSSVSSKEVSELKELISNTKHFLQNHKPHPLLGFEFKAMIKEQILQLVSVLPLDKDLNEELKELNKELSDLYTTTLGGSPTDINTVRKFFNSSEKTLLEKLNENQPEHTLLKEGKSKDLHQADSTLITDTVDFLKHLKNENKQEEFTLYRFLLVKQVAQWYKETDRKKFPNPELPNLMNELGLVFNEKGECTELDAVLNQDKVENNWLLDETFPSALANNIIAGLTADSSAEKISTNTKVLPARDTFFLSKAPASSASPASNEANPKHQESKKP